MPEYTVMDDYPRLTEEAIASLIAETKDKHDHPEVLHISNDCINRWLESEGIKPQASDQRTGCRG